MGKSVPPVTPWQRFFEHLLHVLALMWEPSGGRRSPHPQGLGSWALREASSQAGHLWGLDKVAGEAGKLKKMLEGERGRQGPQEHPGTELKGSCWSGAR